MNRQQDRRRLLRLVATIPFLSGGVAAAPTGQPTTASSTVRSRPGDAGWPTEGQWQELRHQVGGQLLIPRSPLETCLQAPGSAACTALLESLKNPYFIGDEVALTQTLGLGRCLDLQAECLRGRRAEHRRRRGRFVHHGVGSEAWRADGFERAA